VATVSLSALLQECWVDGYAPVYAMMARADGSEEQQEKVQVNLQVFSVKAVTPYDIKQSSRRFSCLAYGTNVYSSIWGAGDYLHAGMHACRSIHLQLLPSS
jgi:hypothetical protein